MSRRKPSGKHRRQRPAKAAVKLAKAYRCGSCISEVRGIRRDDLGVDHINVVHDAECPVLNGVLPDGPDAFRAAARAGVSMLAVRVGGAE
ncbi:hypothetical protein ACFWY6_19870 [Streptomyces sp. NPDC059037]|uniref:hypothetical protein n=1 Tax=Streptomyces sp. NPDC059037 TaxID=3346710 RepID=UPI0036969A1C